MHQRRSSIGRRAKATQAVEFFNVLTSPELLETAESVLPEHRERLYPRTVALSMFLRQVLESDGSCQKAVNAGQRNARPMGSPDAAFAPAGTAGRASVCHWRWSVRLRAITS